MRVEDTAANPRTQDLEFGRLTPADPLFSRCEIPTGVEECPESQTQRSLGHGFSAQRPVAAPCQCAVSRIRVARCQSPPTPVNQILHYQIDESPKPWSPKFLQPQASDMLKPQEPKTLKPGSHKDLTVKDACAQAPLPRTPCLANRAVEVPGGRICPALQLSSD